MNFTANAERAKRNKEIVKLHEKGESFRQLADKYKISFHRVFQIIEREKNRNKT